MYLLDMCISLHASEMSGTKLYAGEAMRDGRYVHLLGYQNNARTLVPGPNAMVLPIPTALPMGPENMIDTRAFRGFMGDIAEATKEPRLRSRGMTKSINDYDSLDVQVFDVGSYTVVLGTKMGAAMSALTRVPAEKRPILAPDVLSSMAKVYPGWAFAICCWNGSIEAEPLLWWYEPKALSFLFAPALDAHDGGPPKEGLVPVDHIITFGSTLKPTGHTPIRYQEQIPDDVRRMLPDRAVGQKVTGRMPNGDFWYATRHFDVADFSKSGPLPALRFWPGSSSVMDIPLGRWS